MYLYWYYNGAKFQKDLYAYINTRKGRVQNQIKSINVHL